MFNFTRNAGKGEGLWKNLIYSGGKSGWFVLRMCISFEPFAVLRKYVYVYI